MNRQELIPHLFRSEYSRIVVVLCRHFGMDKMEAAEDIASETFLAAMERWPYNGIPENPVAWLYTVAKNKARNFRARQQLFSRKVEGELKKTIVTDQETDIDLSPQGIRDSQLRMLFVLCHPSIPQPAQIALSLRILCGFGIDEIAGAFLTNRDTINKRLTRARQKLRKLHLAIVFPAEDEIGGRLDTVLKTLYLLFNEGYYSESRDPVLREDLCVEAMRLVQILADHKATNKPSVKALLALMCFHASRFAARKNGPDGMVLYEDQDEKLWNRELIAKGAELLHQSSAGDTLSRYHVEASIAFWHTCKPDSLEKWTSILRLYHHLLQMEYSPVADMNRIYALSKVEGKEKAIREAEQLNLAGNPYYFVLLGDLYTEINPPQAVMHFKQAGRLARTNTDRQIINAKRESLESRLIKNTPEQ